MHSMRRGLAVLALGGAAMLGLAACAGGGSTGSTEGAAPGPSAVALAEVPEFTSVWWQQSSTEPEFDFTPHTTSEAADLSALREVMAAHGVTGAFRYAHADCEGSLTTWLVATTTAGDEVKLQTNSCEGASGFDVALNELVSGWRTR